MKIWDKSSYEPKYILRQLSIASAGPYFIVTREKIKLEAMLYLPQCLVLFVRPEELSNCMYVIHAELSFVM